MTKGYDLVIAGCGMAGAFAGLTALKKNVDVALIEKKKREFIGKKMCGELMPQKTLQWLKNEVGFTIESYPLKGLEICSSSGHSLYAPEPLCMVDRWKLGQIMVTKLLERGAEINWGTVKGPVGDSPVRGVKTEDSIVYGTVTMDCSGVSSVIRRKLFSGPELLGLAYKENLILRDPVKMEYAKLIFDKKVIRSGYFWFFPKNEYELNVGAGGLGQTLLREKLEKLVKGLNLTVKRREHTGYGIIPLGGPLPSLVHPGLLVCGDAAHHVNPLTGEGIAPALTDGYYAGGTAAEAVKNNNVSLERLWAYNRDFARDYGGVHAPLVIARNFLSSLSDAELTYFLENIVTGEDIAFLIKGKTFDGMKKVRTFLNNWRRPTFLYRVYSAFRQMNEVRRLYECYPENPDEFSSWKKELNSCMKVQQFT